MFRNKKITSVIGILILTMMLGGCGSSKGTDAGDDGNIDKKEYLNTEALENYRQSDEAMTYKVHTLEQGTFSESVLNQSMEWRTLNIPTVRVEVENADIRFGEYQVRMFQQVEAGEVLATVLSEADDIAIDEARLKVQRLQERYEDAKAKQTEDLEDILLNRSMIYNDYERAVADIQYKQSEMDFAIKARDYEYQIEQATKNLNDLLANQTQKEIKSPTAGFVFFETRQASGKELKTGDYICTIVNVEDFYLWTDKQNDLFGYGMQFDFSNGVDKPTGIVINGGSKMLYGNLDKGNTYFQATYKGANSLEDRIRGEALKISGNVKEIQNVVLVPKSAVSQTENGYFVTVLTEDEKLITTEFLPGGSNDEYYWVLKGLSEGMKVIQDAGL